MAGVKNDALLKGMPKNRRGDTLSERGVKVCMAGNKKSTPTKDGDGEGQKRGEEKRSAGKSKKVGNVATDLRGTSHKNGVKGRKRHSPEGERKVQKT